MELAELQELIAHPESLDEHTLPLLKQLLEKYPYFQTAWVLYLKNLYKVEDPSYKEELKRGALYVADLSVLFYYIEGDRFLIEKHKEEPVETTSTTSDRTLDLIDRFLAETPEQEVPATPVKGDSPVPVEMPGDYTSVLLSEVTEEETKAAPLHGHELIDQFIEDAEAHPSETRIELPPEEPSEEETATSSAVSTSTAESSDAAPSEAQSSDGGETEQSAAEENASEDAPAAEEEPEESYFTETLAKIYVRQQRYDKALEIIKKLNLKYPKKNAYFADQIRFLEKLIINAKSK